MNQIQNPSHIVGVIGGMGPAATVDFMSKVIASTPATCDQEHIPMVVSSLPNLPDRSTCLLNGGPSPLPALLYRLQLLEKAGATCIVITCNTAHYWFPQLQKAASVEMISMIDSVAEAASQSRFAKVGLLATDATVSTGLYQAALDKKGIDCVVPKGAVQKAAMDGIYTYKGGNLQKARQIIQEAYLYLQQQQVEAIVLGCTEVPLILANEVRQTPASFLDSNKILAEAVVRWYRAQ